MRAVVPPPGFRHAVDLLLKNRLRTSPLDTERLARDLVALGHDMKAPPDFAAWVIAEFERVLQRPAPAALAQLGCTLPDEGQRCDLFLAYVPEDRLPNAAPLAVELVKRRVSVAFSGYEVESETDLASALLRGLGTNRAGAVLVTPEFLRRRLPEPTPGYRLRILGPLISFRSQAEELVAWLSALPTNDADSAS